MFFRIPPHPSIIVHMECLHFPIIFATLFDKALVLFFETLVLFVAIGVVCASSHARRSRGVVIGGNSLDPARFYETSLLHFDFVVLKSALRNIP